eukprot:s3215_g8.t1
MSVGHLKDVVSRTANVQGVGNGKGPTRACSWTAQSTRTGSGVPLSQVLLGAVVSACGQARRWREALHLYMHGELELPRNAVMCSAVVALQQSVQIDSATYNAAITSSDLGLRWQVSAMLWDQLEQVGLQKQVWCS